MLVLETEHDPECVFDISVSLEYTVYPNMLGLVLCVRGTRYLNLQNTNNHYMCFISVNPCCFYPCQHIGICVRSGMDGYECDCTRTGYYGENCTIRK